MKEELHQLARDLRFRYQKKINDTYIWSSVVIEAIKAATIDDEFLEKERFNVPSRNAAQTRRVSRTKREMVEILQLAGGTDFNYSILAFIVGQVEAFLSDLVFSVLRIDKRRLKTRVPGINHVNKIDVEDALDADDIGELIDKIIERELTSIFYASPEKQFEYLQKVIGVSFDNKLTDLTGKWREYKATRDIIVHNSGVVNALYLKKAGDLARWQLDEQVRIDRKYLDGLVAESKSLIGKICNSIQNKSKTPKRSKQKT